MADHIEIVLFGNEVPNQNVRIDCEFPSVTGHAFIAVPFERNLILLQTIRILHCLLLCIAAFSIILDVLYVIAFPVSIYFLALAHSSAPLKGDAVSWPLDSGHVRACRLVACVWVPYPGHGFNSVK
jgi:hypothetical protein